MPVVRSFDLRMRSRSFFRDRDRWSPFGQKIAGRSRSRSSTIAFAKTLFYSNQPFAGQIFQNCHSLKNENFEKKLLVALNKHFCKWSSTSLPMKLVKTDRDRHRRSFFKWWSRSRSQFSRSVSCPRKVSTRVSKYVTRFFFLFKKLSVKRTTTRKSNFKITSTLHARGKNCNLIWPKRYT